MSRIIRIFFFFINYRRSRCNTPINPVQEKESIIESIHCMVNFCNRQNDDFCVPYINAFTVMRTYKQYWLLKIEQQVRC